MGAVIAPVIDFALTDVPHQVAGSASGVLNTSGQLGSAIGIALVAVLFLSVLPDQSDKGIDAVEAKIRAELTVSGVRDRPTQDGILTAHRACAEDRLAEVDPSVVPASCQARRRASPRNRPRRCSAHWPSTPPRRGRRPSPMPSGPGCSRSPDCSR
ncbi:hypothetical protein NKH77_04130 [Streptomyces sp. M19]